MAALAPRLVFRAWLAALLLACLSLAAQAQIQSAIGVLVLNDTQAQVAAWPGVRMLADKGGKLGLADVMAAPGQFSVPTTAANTLELRKEAVWLRIPIAVDAASNGQWILDIDYALAPHDGNDGGSLLKRADAAMYAGKQDGKNCIHRGEASERFT